MSVCLSVCLYVCFVHELRVLLSVASSEKKLGRRNKGGEEGGAGYGL